MRRRDDFAYARLHKELKHEILKGALKPGEMIPSENTLCDLYKMSRSSVRKALAALVDEGLIIKQAGKGNFVSPELEHSPQVQTLKVGVYVPALELAKILKALDIFEQQHPLVRVQPVRISSADNYSHTVKDLAAEGGLDAFMVSDYHFGDFRPGADLVDLRPFLPPGWKTERDSYPTVFEAFQSEKGLYAMPVVFSPVMLCYNKELFDRAGVDYPDASWTWETMVENAKKLTVDRGGESNQYGLCFSSSLNRWPIWLMQNGARLRGPRNRAPKLDSPRIAEAVQFAADLMYKHKVSPIYGSAMDHAAEDLFVRGRVAMVLTTYFYMNDFFSLDFPWDVAEPPMGRERATIMLSTGMAVSAHSHRQELAQSLVRYFLQESTQQFLKQEGCSIPVLKSVAESRSNFNPAIHPDGYFAFTNTLAYAQVLDALGERNHLQILGRELGLVWANMEPVGATLKRASERVRADQ
jgi:multiple sugar transport system substrate-binding protein